MDTGEIRETVPKYPTSRETVKAIAPIVTLREAAIHRQSGWRRSAPSRSVPSFAGKPSRHGLLHPPGEGQNPRHRGKGELKAHTQAGVGVLEQQKEQRQGQAGGGVILPAQQGTSNSSPFITAARTTEGVPPTIRT